MFLEGGEAKDCELKTGPSVIKFTYVIYKLQEKFFCEKQLTKKLLVNLHSYKYSIY